MKDEGALLIIGIWILVCIIVGFAVGDALATTYERTRIYEKCLVEQGAQPHKEAVTICKERVK